VKLYLSSYKLGDRAEELKRLVPRQNRKVAFIPNALDFVDDLKMRRRSELADIRDLERLGLHVDVLDLRDYFSRLPLLEKKVKEFGAFWARGGNAFVLRQAMSLSGFDEVLRGLSSRQDLLYGGYSAGVCVLAPTLRGIDLMDNLAAWPYGRKSRLIWAGLGLISYSIVPHFESDHPESDRAAKAADYLKEHNMPYKTLRDGEVVVEDSLPVPL